MDKRQNAKKLEMETADNIMINKVNSKNPVRVAHIVGKMVGGGLEATVLNYYRHIDRSKIQYDFFVDSDSVLVPEDEINSLGGRVILIPPYQKPVQYQRELNRLLKKNQYTMVYAHMNTLSIFPLFAAWRAKVPIRVAHNHSTAGKGELKKNLMKYTLRPFAKVFPTNLCACSKFAGKWLFGKKAIRDHQITIWQNAVEVRNFLFSQGIRDKTRKELGVSDKYVIAHVGRFIHQKNHDFIIDIFSEIHRKKSDAVLLLVGSGELMSHIKNRVQSLGLADAVIFTGNISNIANIYQAMDVFLLPSFYEGLGMVAVEAQIAGLPVLCADTVPEEAKICENMQYYSLNDSAEKWADAALSFSKGFVRENMQKNAVEKGYDIEKAAEKMTAWYTQLLNM